LTEPVARRAFVTASVTAPWLKVHIAGVRPSCDAAHAMALQKADDRHVAPLVGTLEASSRVNVLVEAQDPDDDPTPWYWIDGGRCTGVRLYIGRTASRAT
jgi:hypothetical protein